jgi:uncharacterized phage protein gp47/JayE
MSYDYTNGVLSLPTLPEIIERKTAEMVEIYGGDINLESNTPDGQRLNIEAQAEADMGELLRDTINGLNIDTASGNDLDRLALFKMIKRRGGSYTIMPILIITNRILSLENTFRISDTQGNTYHLQSQATLVNGDNILNFVSDTIGDIVPPLNTINTIVSVTLGVVSVSNPYSPLFVGAQEESDAVLRERLKQSSVLGGQGSVDNIRSAILQVDGVVSCTIDSNRTNATNANGTPAHYNWIVVNGGADIDVANAIYETINNGAGMKGSVVVGIQTQQETIENIIFDRPQAEDLHISFTVTARTSEVVVEEEALKEYLVSNFKGKINGSVDNNQIIDLLIHYNNGIYLYFNVLVDKVSPPALVIVQNTNFNNYFTLSANNITITVA